MIELGPELRMHLKDGAFTRSGQIHPTALIVNDLLNHAQSAASAARSLRDDFDIVTPEASRLLTAVSPSAIVQARAKILPSLWAAINQIIVDTLRCCGELSTFKGHLVSAVDGSILWGNKLITAGFVDALIPALKDKYDKRQSGASPFLHQLQAVMRYDPLNQIHLGHEIELQLLSERDLLLPLLDEMSPGELLLMDRGYPAAWLFVDLQRRGIEFLCRLRCDHSEAVEKFVASSETDAWLELPIAYKSLIKLKDLQIPMPASKTVRVRVVKVESGGRSLLLVTSLSAAKANGDELADLYAGRWGIEKEIYTFKEPLELEAWRGFSRPGVLYDIGAKAAAYNLALLMAWPVRQELRARKLSGNGFRAVLCLTRALGELKPALMPILGPRTSTLSSEQLILRYQNELRHKPSVIDPTRSNLINSKRINPDRRNRSQKKAV